MKWIDLRSDTVTEPTAAMREAMLHAEVGDDGFDDDPTIHELEEYAARLVGKERALFVTSGMQGNACAMMAQTRWGDCVVLAPGSHIAGHEAGSYAHIAGVSLRHPESINGVMDPLSVRACLSDESELHFAPAGLVVLENAHSFGTVLPLENMREIYETAHERGVPVHLDGARLFNAAAALEAEDVRELTQYTDTVSFCLSKGLCAPVGSLLAGPEAVIQRAKRARRALGGSLRQAGFLAAAGLVALREMPGRLHEDHENARYLAELMDKIDGIQILWDRLQINMVFFQTDWGPEQAAQYPEWMLAHGVKVVGLMGGEYRLVTHHGVTRADCSAAAALLAEFAEGLRP